MSISHTVNNEPYYLTVILYQQYPLIICFIIQPNRHDNFTEFHNVPSSPIYPFLKNVTSGGFYFNLRGGSSFISFKCTINVRFNFEIVLLLLNDRGVLPSELRFEILGKEDPIVLLN